MTQSQITVTYKPDDAAHPPEVDDAGKSKLRKIVLGGNEFTEGEARDFTVDDELESHRIFAEAVKGNPHFEVSEAGYQAEEDDDHPTRRSRGRK
jgi:hypothetical protein